MNAFKQILLYNWNLMRWLRLALGLLMGYEAIVMSDSLAGVIAALFLFQALTNTGCCMGGNCATPGTSKRFEQEEEVVYEKIENL